MTVRARSALAAALVVAALVVGLGVRLDGMARTISTRTYERPLGDDSFYYFSLGRNLASGQGFRIDALHPTTGFQPLWGVLVALPYLIDPAHGIQGAQVLGILVGMVAFGLIFALTRRVTGNPLLAAASAALWWLHPATVTANLSGMETTLATTSALALFLALDRLYDRTYSGTTLLGVALGVAVLARVDLLVLAGTAVFLLLIALPSRLFRRVVLSKILPVAALMLVPWLLLVWSLGKPPLPESGLAVRALIGYFYPNDPSMLAPAHQLALFAAQIASQLYLTEGLRLLIPMLSAEACALAALILAAASTRHDVKPRGMVGVLALWWIGITIAYAVTVPAFWYFDRYALPAAQVGAVVLIACLGRAALRSHWPRLMAGALMIMLALAAIVGANGYRAGRYDWLSGNAPPDEGLYRTAEWLNTHLPPGTRVGVFQSGLIGYYATVSVINLDGKVNGAAREALANGTMWNYVCAEGIAYVADWPSMIDQLLKARSAAWRDDALTFVARIEPVAPTIAPIEIDKVNCRR